MEANITVEEIDMIMDSLEIYENHQSNSAGVSGMLGAILSSGVSDDAGRKEFENHVEQKRLEAVEKDKAVKEKSILLRAKLIHIKQAVAVKEAVNW